MKKPSEITIIVDQREVKSGIVGELEDLSNHLRHVNIIVRTLEVGDYIASDVCAVERKTCDDMIASVIDKKDHLFGQLADMGRAYRKSILIIEGDMMDLYGSRMVNPTAIHGMLVAVARSFHMPTLWTSSVSHTAQMLVVLAEKEQIENHRIPSVHGSRSKMTIPKQQEYIVSSINKLGPGKAIKLLKHFGTVENVMNASMKELMEVDDVGETIAKTIRDILTMEYKK